MKVIALAQNFGFGPISMLNRAIVSLPAEIQVEFYVLEHLKYVLDIRSGTKVNIISSEKEIMGIPLEDYDAAIIACDYPLADVVYERIGKVIVYDMLFWFWPELHEVIEKEILLIAQNFVGVEQRAKGYKSVKVVGPLLPHGFYTSFSMHGRKGVLVNLGGFQSPHHTVSEASVYLSNLSPFLFEFIECGYDLTIAGGSLILDQLILEWPQLAKNIKKLQHSELREMLAEVAIYLTIPGLGSIYESFFTGVPTFFLPPSNFTQALQLEAVRSQIPDVCGFELSTIANGHLYNKHEDEYIHALFDLYQEDKENVQAMISDNLHKFMLQPVEHFQNLANYGKTFVDQLGGPGEELAVKYVLEYLNV